MFTSKRIARAKHGLHDDSYLVQLFTTRDTFQYYETRNDDDTKKHCDECYKWCKENVGPEDDKWCRDGVTIHSFRIIFIDKIDVVAFKLRFGL